MPTGGEKHTNTGVCMLPKGTGTKSSFFGGKDYVPLFCAEQQRER